MPSRCFGPALVKVLGQVAYIDNPIPTLNACRNREVASANLVMGGSNGNSQFFARLRQRDGQALVFHAQKKEGIHQNHPRAVLFSRATGRH